MKAAEVPAGLRAILDRAAGKEHSAAGPVMLDLMAEAMTATFTGHPQRRAQALAANRVIAERMWPPIKAALDERDAEIADLRASLTAAVSAEFKARDEADRQRSRADIATRLTAREHERAEKAEAERDRLYTAWWSARIGRAHDRASAQAWRDNCLVIGGERDQAKAAIAQVRRLCDLTIAVSVRVDAIDQAQDTLGVLARCDLPAVREFVADFDPRKEP